MQTEANFTHVFQLFGSYRNRRRLLPDLSLAGRATTYLIEKTFNPVLQRVAQQQRCQQSVQAGLIVIDKCDQTILRDVSSGTDISLVCLPLSITIKPA
jgi:hypothetical protein